MLEFLNIHSHSKGIVPRVIPTVLISNKSSEIELRFTLKYMRIASLYKVPHFIERVIVVTKPSLSKLIMIYKLGRHHIWIQHVEKVYKRLSAGFSLEIPPGSPFNNS